MQLQVGVKVLLKNKQDKYLLLERNFEKYPDVPRSDKWDIVGGRIEIGSSLLDNLKREIFEETKLALTERPRLIAAQDILRPDKHVVRLTYTAGIEGEPVLDEDHSAYHWFSLDELKQMSDLDQYAKEAMRLIE